MSFFYLILLAVIQGVTEFLPVSSSAHLVLFPALTGQEDQGLVIDVAVHVGSLCAVLLYFRHDVYDLCIGFLKLCAGKKTQAGRESIYLIIATIPVLIAGYLLHRAMPEGIRDLEVIAATTIIFGLLLWAADVWGRKTRSYHDISVLDALIVGCLQVFALIPGTSRSGITMTAARMLGFNPKDAARFSLLLSIPTIMGAGFLGGVDLYQSGSYVLGQAALWSLLLSFIAAYIAISVMMRWLSKSGFLPFVIYRLLLGLGLVIYLYL